MALLLSAATALARRAGLVQRAGAPSGAGARAGAAAAAALVPRALLAAGALLPPTFSAPGLRWANSKAGGSTRNGRDSQPKYLGVKKYGGQWVEPGHIIVRQRGQKFGIVDSTATVGFGRDWTVYALKPGYVKFWYHRVKRKSYIEVVRSPPAQGGADGLVGRAAAAVASAAAALAAGGKGGAGGPEGQAALAAARAAHAAAVAAAEPEQYPIVSLKRWEYPALAKIVDARAKAGKPLPAVSSEVAEALLAWRAGEDATKSSGGPAALVARLGPAAAAATLAGGKRAVGQLGQQPGVAASAGAGGAAGAGAGAGA